MDREKYVDESWKESVELEKKKLSHPRAPESAGAPSPRQEEPPASRQETRRPEPQTPESPREEAPEDESAMSFLNYISGLAYQAMMFLGLIPHPETGEAMPADPEQAKFFIDTLIMLRGKTKGNLSKKEDDMLNASIYELQMRFVEANTKEAGQ